MKILEKNHNFYYFSRKIAFDHVISINQSHFFFRIRVDSNISDVITKLFSLASEPTVAVITLENVVMLFEIHEEVSNHYHFITISPLPDALHNPRSSEAISGRFSETSAASRRRHSRSPRSVRNR